jgi:hypothetical protein
MKASLRVCMAAAWLGLAASVSAASAQGQPAPTANPADGCGPLCRFFGGAAPVQQAQPQPQAEEPSENPRRRARRAEKRRADPSAEPARADAEPAQRRRPARKPREASAAKGPAARPGADVEQTASVSARPEEILFVSGADDAHRAVAEDLGRAVAPDFSVRVVSGKGLPLRDVLSVPGADVTIASSLVLAHASAYSDKIVYVAKLFTEELHALAGPGITRLEDLAGKPVYLGPVDSDSAAAADALLQSRGVSVNPVGGSLASAITRVREGRLAAAFILAPKPFPPLKELAHGLRILPLVYRSSDRAFHPAALTHADYPGLIGERERIETVAVDAVLVAPRWRDNTPRQQELAAFTTRFFERLASLGSGHPKWSETNLASNVEGYPRLKPAEQWVAARLKARSSSAGVADAPGSRVGEAR